MPTMDEIARFLAVIACDGVASSPVLGLTLDTSINPQLPILSASALGAMINVDNGSPFWKQRMIHLITQILLSRLNPKSEKILSQSEYGRLLSACHIMCCLSFKSLGEETIHKLVALIIESFESHVCDCCCEKEPARTNNKVDSIIIAAMMRSMEFSPPMVCSQMKFMVQFC